MPIRYAVKQLWQIFGSRQNLVIDKISIMFHGSVRKDFIVFKFLHSIFGGLFQTNNLLKTHDKSQTWLLYVEWNIENLNILSEDVRRPCENVFGKRKVWFRLSWLYLEPLKFIAPLIFYITAELALTGRHQHIFYFLH